MRKIWLVLFIAAGCETGGGAGVAVDATPDVPPVPVVALSSCPATVAATITDTPTAFVPKDSTIGVGDVAKFVITSEHYVIPNTLKTTDPGLMVSRGQTKCFRFDVPGTYNFLCAVHSFPGSITVE